MVRFREVGAEEERQGEAVLLAGPTAWGSGPGAVQKDMDTVSHVGGGVSSVPTKRQRVEEQRANPPSMDHPGQT